MSFPICIERKGKWYRMQVTVTHQSDSLIRFDVQGGSRILQLQTDRPAAKKSGRKPSWKILSGEVRSGDLQESALAVLKIFDAIEKHYAPVEERNVHQREKD